MACKKKKSNSEGKFRRQIPLLKVLKDLKPEARAIILASLDSSSCNEIVSCVRKVLQGKKLNSRTKKRIAKALSPQKNLYRDLINTNSFKAKKEILPKLGGSISLILSAAIPILLEIARAKKWI